VTTEIETGPKVPVPKPRAKTHVAADCFRCRATQSSGRKSRNPDLATAVPHRNIAGFDRSARLTASGSTWQPIEPVSAITDSWLGLHTAGGNRSIACVGNARPHVEPRSVWEAYDHPHARAQDGSFGAVFPYGVLT